MMPACATDPPFFATFLHPSGEGVAQVPPQENRAFQVQIRRLPTHAADLADGRRQVAGQQYISRCGCGAPQPACLPGELVMA